MKFPRVAALFILPSLAILLSFNTLNSPGQPGEFCRELVTGNLVGIQSELKSSLFIVDNFNGTKEELSSLKDRYRNARRYYKEVEFFIEYYMPFEAKFYINGPLVPKVELEISNDAIEPQGFQVIEEQLFDDTKRDLAKLKSEYNLLYDHLAFLREHFSTIRIEDDKVHEALRLQLVRMMCLTLNGYDCTINKEAITEMNYNLDGIAKVVTYYTNDNRGSNARILRLVKKAKRRLKSHPDSDSFNRLALITSDLQPIYAASAALYRTGPEIQGVRYAVNTGSVFAGLSSINKQYFSVYKDDTFNLHHQAELGQLLFYDPVLSGNNKRACASCHKPEKAFTDGLDKSLQYDGISKVARNAPTLVNSAYQKLYFHDGRSFNLEGQADAVFNNTFEMNIGAEELVKKLRSSREYQELFKDAFKKGDDAQITFYAVLKCIAEFIKTLDSRNSRFDMYLRGDHSKLNREEVRGFNLFSGKALCGSCHFFPLFNGTVPPMYNDNEFEVIGVPGKDGQQIDSDRGREIVTGSPVHRHAFKTPTLRNVALTAPYMHNGVYNNLDSVLSFYNRGGGAGVGMQVPNQTLPFDSLGLTQKELHAIKAFMLCLTDTSGIPKPPARLPVFVDPQLNQRRIGGEY